MNVYWNGLPVDQFPSHIRRPGELFTRLVGVDVSSDGKSAVPQYIPLIRWRKQAGQTFIEINSTRPLVYITFQWRHPYIHVFIFPWRLWDKEIT